MSNRHYTLNYGPAHIDPIVKLHDGVATIHEIGEDIRHCLFAGFSVVHIVLRTTSHQECEGDQKVREPDLHIIRQRLNDVLRGEARVCVRPDGDLEAKSGTLNTIHPIDLKDQIHGHFGSLVSDPESAFDVPPEEWRDHIAASRMAVRDSERRYGGGKLAPDHAGRRLRGTAAEFMLHRVLERYRQVGRKCQAENRVSALG